MFMRPHRQALPLSLLPHATSISVEENQQKIALLCRVGHHVNPQEVADIKAWLLEHLPPT
jgi:hypothetical protein